MGNEAWSTGPAPQIYCLQNISTGEMDTKIECAHHGTRRQQPPKTWAEAVLT